MVLDKALSIISALSIAILISGINWCLNFLTIRHSLVLFLTSILLFWGIAYYYPKLNYHVVFSVSLFKERISNGSWQTTFYVLNVMKTCTSLGPILIIRDVKNLGEQHLHKLFTTLQCKKEPECPIHKFPIILKTSDNLWMKIA